MLLSLCYVLVRRVLHVVVWRWHSNVVKELEIAVLRHELAILRRHTKRPALTTVDRLHGRIGTRCRIDLEPAQYPVRNAGRRAVERFWGACEGRGARTSSRPFRGTASPENGITDSTCASPEVCDSPVVRPLRRSPRASTSSTDRTSTVSTRRSTTVPRRRRQPRSARRSS